MFVVSSHFKNAQCLTLSSFSASLVHFESHFSGWCEAVGGGGGVRGGERDSNSSTYYSIDYLHSILNLHHDRLC